MSGATVPSGSIVEGVRDMGLLLFWGVNVVTCCLLSRPPRDGRSGSRRGVRKSTSLLLGAG